MRAPSARATRTWLVGDGRVVLEVEHVPRDQEQHRELLEAGGAGDIPGSGVDGAPHRRQPRHSHCFLLRSLSTAAWPSAHPPGPGSCAAAADTSLAVVAFPRSPAHVAASSASVRVSTADAGSTFTEYPSRLKKERGRFPAPTLGEPDGRVQAHRLGPCHRVVKPARGAHQQVPCLLVRAGFQIRIGGTEAAEGLANGVGGEVCRTHEEGGGAAATPPRSLALPADRSSSPARVTSGPIAAAARCQARRSGSVSRLVTSARARWASRRSSGDAAAVDGGPHERMAEAQVGPDREEAGFLGRSSNVPGMPSRSAARQILQTSPS